MMHLVALIDCRSFNFARCSFTPWHQIAHRLTTHADLLERVYRSEHDPIERLMEEIRFPSRPTKASQGKQHLSFSTFETILSSAFPPASFQATLFACIRRLSTPVIYLEAALAHMKEVKRLLQTPSLFGDDPQPGELRAVKVIPNAAAQEESFYIPTNMRVPVASVIHRLFDAEPLSDGDGKEFRGRSQGCRPGDRHRAAGGNRENEPFIL